MAALSLHGIDQELIFPDPSLSLIPLLPGLSTTPLINHVSPPPLLSSWSGPPSALAWVIVVISSSALACFVLYMAARVMLLNQVELVSCLYSKPSNAFPLILKSKVLKPTWSYRIWSLILSWWSHLFLFSLTPFQANWSPCHAYPCLRTFTLASLSGIVISVPSLELSSNVTSVRLLWPPYRKL